MSGAGEIGPIGRGGTAAKLFATPRARKLARERGVNLAQMRGTGPRGRIIAADIDSVAEPAGPSTRNGRIAALGMTFDPAPAATLCASFAKAGLDVDVEDAIIGAVIASLAAARDAGDAPNTLSFRSSGGDLRFDGAPAMSLSAIHRARSAEPSPAQVATTAPALSLEIVRGDGLAALFLQPFHGLEMRLMISIGDDARANLFFDEDRLSPALVASILGLLKQRLELPVLLLV